MAPLFDSHPKLLPAYRNLPWDIPADFRDDNPLLAIIELKPRSEIDFLEPGTPYNNLLRKALEYCSSIPGTWIHYGQVRGDSAVVILVELPSPRAWQDFNSSAVLDLLFATFESNPICNCLHWAVPQSFELSGSVELLTINLGPVSEVSFANKGLQFDQAWADFSKAVAATGKCNAHGDWANGYCMASLFSDHPPGQRAAVIAAWDAQPMTFMGIMSGAGTSIDSVNGDLRSIVSEFAQKYEGRVSRRTLDLKRWSEQSLYPPHTDPAQPASPLLLFEPVKPVYRRKNGMSLSGEDMTWRSNYYAARRAKIGGFPEPRGGYYPLGTINQYSCPLLPKLQADTDASLRMVDMLWLTFRAGALITPADQAEQSSGLAVRFEQFRKDIAALDHCEALYWARRHEETNVVVLFIVWRSLESRPRDLLAMCQPLFQRSGILDDLECEPGQGKSFPIDTGALIGLLMAQHLELMTFYAPDTPEAKRLLQVHVSRFSDTARVLGVIAGRGSAGKCVNSSYATNSEQQAEYICMWTWRGLEARERWYSQFREIMTENYERLGHIVDGVRLVATGGIRSELLDAQLDIFGWMMPLPSIMVTSREE